MFIGFIHYITGSAHNNRVNNNNESKSILLDKNGYICVSETVVFHAFFNPLTHLSTKIMSIRLMSLQFCVSNILQDLYTEYIPSIHTIYIRVVSKHAIP